MAVSRTARHAGRIGLTTALLGAGVVATAPSTRAADTVPINPDCRRVGNSMQCPYDVRDQVGVFTVPAGVGALTVALRGGDGGKGAGYPGGSEGGPGGAGGTATVTVGSPLTDAGTELRVYLGGDGGDGGDDSDDGPAECEGDGGTAGLTAGFAPSPGPQGGRGGQEAEAEALSLPADPSLPVRCAGGGGGAAGFVMLGQDLPDPSGDGVAPVVAAGGGGGGGGGGNFVVTAVDGSRAGGKGGPGAEDGRSVADDLGGKSGENGGANGGSGGESQSGGNGGDGDDTPGGSEDGGGGGGGGGYVVGGGGGSDGSGGGGGCGFTPAPDLSLCEESEEQPENLRSADEPPGGAFRAAADDPGVIFSWELPAQPPTTAVVPPPAPPGSGPGGGGPASNDPNPNTNPESFERIRRQIGPNTVTAICRPGQICTVEPPAGPDSAFGISGADGTRRAILFGTLNGNYRPASAEAGKAEGRPDCPGYRERNRDWVQFGFVDENDGATWRKTAVMTQRQKLKKTTATKLARELQICFAAPYTFRTRAGYRLGTNGPDRVGVLPDCPSANRVRTAVGRPSPCVASREVVAVEGGWVVRLTFKIPATDKDPKALG